MLTHEVAEADVERVRAVEARLQEATRSHDVRTLSELLHPASVLISNGVRYSRRVVLRAHESRKLALTLFRVVGHVAVAHHPGGGMVASFRAVLEGHFDGRRCDGSYLYERIWRLTDSGWRALFATVSPEPS